MIKRKLVLWTLLVSMLMTTMLPVRVGATSWAFPFIVWNDSIYVTSDEPVTDVGKKIGKVTSHSDMEQYGGNFSNIYEKGTKYYSIDGISTNVAIAVEVSNGKFIRANYESPYTFKKGPTDYIYSGLFIFAMLVIGIIIYPLVKKFRK